MGKKVLHIALPHGGGVCVYVRMLLDHAPDDIENSLICAADLRDEITEKCPVHILDIPREIKLKDDLFAVREIKKQIKRIKPDVIYCHSSMAGAVGRLAAIGSGIPVIYNPHGWSFDIKNKSKKSKIAFCFTEKFLALFTKQILCISEYEKTVALQKHIAKKEKFKVILNGIDLQKGENLPDTSDNRFFTVGCCARLSFQKSPLLFADTMGKVARKLPSARFVWIGDGELRREFEEALKKNGIWEKTTVTGWVNDPETYISGIDVGVLFSAWEGFGLSVVDYLNQGKPVVTSAVGGIPEIVTSGVGITVDSENAEDFAEAIVSLADGRKREEMSVLCRERAKKFDIRTTAEKTFELIRQL